MITIETILCPTDFSEPSQRALELARLLAARFGAKLHLLHCIDVVPLVPTLRVGAAMPTFDVAGYRKALRDSAAADLKALAESQASADVEVVTHLKDGTPSLEIVDAADGIGADLVVIATHGRSGWRRMLFGSVAEKVVRTSPCPVLTVNNRDAAE